MTLPILRLVHLVGMALWIGASLFANSDIRRSFANPSELPGLRERMKRVGRVSIAGALATVLGGFGLIFPMGGMAAMPWPIHAGMGLGLITWAIGIAIGVTWGSIEKGLAAGAAPDTLAPLCQRIRMLGGAFHGLWFVTLILMVFRGVLG